MITENFAALEKDLETNPVDRHEDKLNQIADWIIQQHEADKTAKLNFICTHNSRRSQFSQVWFLAAQAYMGLNAAEAYSGGTEVTACNERTIAALKRAGFTITSKGEGNPVYTVSDPSLNLKTQLWSKVYDDDQNPSENFAAIMTCDHADANCPFIPGAEIRIPLTYKDPKYSDGTDEEEKAYDRTCTIIATDMVRLFKKVKAKLY